MADDDTLPDLLTNADLRRMFPVKASTLASWRHRGIGPKSFRLGGTVVYHRADVVAWIAEQEADTAKGGAAPEAVA